MCCSGDKIYMDYYSVLGPIDPQVMNKDGKFVAALGYLDKINELIKKARDNELKMNSLDKKICDEYEAATIEFERLVTKGVASKRGYQLLPIESKNFGNIEINHSRNK